MPGDSSVDLLAPHERFPLKSFTALQYSLPSPVVYVIGRDVAKCFVIATRVVVVDKPRDLVLQIVGVFPDNETNLLLAGAMIALDLSVGLGMVRGGKDMPYTLGLQVFAERF